MIDWKRTLIKNLDLTVFEGKNLLIVRNFCDRNSSLLRTVSGLWTAGLGAITCALNNKVCFLPQCTYYILGLLKDQLLYLSTESLNPDNYPKEH